MRTVIEAGDRFRVRRQVAHDQRRIRQDNETFFASCAIEARAGEVLETSKKLLKDCEGCLPKKDRMH
ncbi:MAG: hypothetical protein PHF60_05105 [Candidatus ainarchaeum sp.]|nr:hypothetical protein [Candidatus ainarchaeum sp.]